MMNRNEINILQIIPNSTSSLFQNLLENKRNTLKLPDSSRNMTEGRCVLYNILEIIDLPNRLDGAKISGWQ